MIVRVVIQTTCAGHIVPKADSQPDDDDAAAVDDEDDDDWQMIVDLRWRNLASVKE